MEIPKPPQTELKPDQDAQQNEVMMNLARVILSELWTEPITDGGIIAKFLPYANLVVLVVVLAVLIFKK